MNSKMELFYTQLKLLKLSVVTIPFKDNLNDGATIFSWWNTVHEDPPEGHEGLSEHLSSIVSIV